MTKGYQQRKASNERYLATQDTIAIRVAKESGLKDTIRAHAEGRGESVQAFILRAIQTQMEQDKEESDAE